MGQISAEQYSPKVQVFQDLLKHYGATRHSTDLAITTSLRSNYPDCTVTVTPETTGIFTFAKAGQAEAKLDTMTDGYAAWRTHRPVTNRSETRGVLKNNVSFGKYDVIWNGRTFIIYRASFFQDYTVQKNNYIVYPVEDDEIIDGQSKAADELIAAASQWTAGLHNEVCRLPSLKHLNASVHFYTSGQYIFPCLSLISVYIL